MSAKVHSQKENSPLINKDFNYTLSGKNFKK